MMNQMNEVGCDYIETAEKVSKFQCFVYLPIASLIGGILIFYGVHSLIIDMIGIPIVIFIFLYNLVYRPLIYDGRLINSLVIDIEFSGQDIIYHTAKSVLYPSKEIKVSVSNVMRIESVHFFAYPQKIVMQSGDEPSTRVFIIKDFFDDYDLIDSRIPIPPSNYR